MLIQLRTYTINRGALDTFASEWQKTIKPLREKLGFQILGAWKMAATNQFVWLLSHADAENWDTLDQAYYQSPERRAMEPNPARHIARAEEYFIKPVE